MTSRGDGAVTSTIAGRAGAADASTAWPVIDLRLRPMTLVGRNRACDVQIPHGQVSGEHARFHRPPGGPAQVEDCDSRYGTAVNGARVRTAQLRPGDLVEFGGALLYRFDGDCLRPENGLPGAAIWFSDVSLERGGRKLLSGVNVGIRSGSFVAVLGPSGAGKSLLLGCLATTLEPSGGEILIDDGKPGGGRRPLTPSLAEYRSRLGIVAQDDIVHPTLTARENLWYAAQLRLPTGNQPDALSPADIERRIADALQDVGLAEHADKPVSVMSGGQRKRVSVAIELLRRPRLLLLDEPTSGLDPGMQARVMDMLRRLSRQGITVVTTTHTMDTLHFFDAAVILAPVGGSTTVVYHGPAGDVYRQFGVRDAADLFDRLSALPSSAGDIPMAVAASPVPPTASPNDDPIPPTALHEATRPARLSSPIQTLAAQAGVIARRSLLGLARDRTALALTITQPIVLALLIAASQGRQDRSTTFHFFLVVSAIWVGMTVAVREMVRERPHYLRDRLAGLRPVSYLLGKVAFASSVAASQSLLLGLLARWLAGVFPLTVTAADDLAKTSILATALGVMLCGVGGALVGLTLSAIARTEQAAVAMLPLVLLPMILFSRVATGDTLSSWSDKQSPFLPLADVRAAVADKEFTSHKAALIVVSAGLLTRPGTAAIDTVQDVRIVDRGANLVEWLHLAALLGAHSALLAGVFLWCDRRWKSVR
jgi:ABC-type multidrug transport system ATPase subunit